MVDNLHGDVILMHVFEFDVFVESARLPGPVRTKVTGVGLLAAVHHVVVPEIPFVRELHETHGAAVSVGELRYQSCEG